MRGSWHGKRGVKSATLDQGIYLRHNWRSVIECKACLLLSDHCGHRSLLESLGMVHQFAL